VDKSGTAIAIRGKDGVVFAVEKIVTSKLFEKASNKRIFNADRQIGVAVSGLYTDACALVTPFVVHFYTSVTSISNLSLT